MSLEAFIWATKLPLDIVTPTAFRVLLLLANHAHSDGRNVWRKKSEVAAELGCSLRTVERSIRDLKMQGLIRDGDQRLTDHLRGDRRPVVYDLNFRYGQPELDIDDTTATDAPYGPTSVSRPDSVRTDAPTTGVVHRTVKEPGKSPSRGNQTRAVGACGHDLIDDRHCERGCRVALTIGETA